MTLTGDLNEYFEVDASDFSVLVTKKEVTRSITSISGNVDCVGTDSFVDDTQVWFY